jgi:hypothetical protein
MNSPKDALFRAGSISSKEWAKLHPNEHGGGKGSQKSKMAKFESKEKDEGNTKRKSTSATTGRHIDRNQTMGTPAKAGGKPSHGGAVGGSHKSPTRDAINQNQKPNFPRQGTGSARKTLSAQQPATTNETKGYQYGGPSSREDKPIRVW